MDREPEPGRWTSERVCDANTQRRELDAGILMPHAKVPRPAFEK